MNFRQCRPRSTSSILFGLCLILAGTFCICYTSIITNLILDSVLLLGPNSPVLDFWQNTDPIILDFYIFNWTNPDEIHDLTKKPKLEELGPYRLKEVRRKVNVTWHPENGTVTYRQMRHWYYVEDYPSRSLQDVITILNPVTVTAANMAKNWNYLSKLGLSATIAALSPELHVTKTAREWIFDGYQDSLLDLARDFHFLPQDSIFGDKFSFLYNRNGSHTFDGAFNVETGARKGRAFGELRSWRDYNETALPEDYCTSVGGSSGEVFKRRTPKSGVEVFSADVCLKMIFHYEEDVVVNNMDCHRYSADNMIISNGILPETNCRCNSECIPSGMLNLTACKSGAPTFLSLPHFYLADPVYLAKIDGMKPEKSKHEMYITVEPETGVSLMGCYRAQMSLHLEPIQYLTLFEEVPDLFMPILWTEQKYELSIKITLLIWILTRLPTIFTTISILLIVAGFITILNAAYKLNKKKSYHKEEDKSYPEFPKLMEPH